MAAFATNLQFITSSDGAKIYADAAGNPSKPPIVFIHGLALSGAVFDNIFNNESYKRSFYLVRYDMRGHGRSAKPETIEGYSSKLYADDFSAVMKRFNLKKPVIVGWSLGCTVVTDVAHHLPFGTISGVVYLSALPYIGPVMERVGTATVLGMLPGLFCEDSVTTSLKVALNFIDTLFLDPAVIPWQTKCLWLGMVVCQTPSHRKFVLTRPQDPAKLLELGNKGLPLLIVNGTEDQQVNGERVVEEMKAHFRDLEVAMIGKNGSHSIFYENQDEVMDNITRFVSKVHAHLGNVDRPSELAGGDVAG
ncbi:alpha/beta-hydrolase [Phellopilus nigrolimitatus]|nr:alpha/beta-hydrolase [Phellopilus nigrolimitatus]